VDPVRSAIPHREPFLFVDEIVEQAADRLRTRWRVPPDADFLRGHYPGRPLVPGVILCARGLEPAGPDAVPVLTRIGEARFKRMVGPGETVECEVHLDQRVGPARYLTARLSVGGKAVLRVEFTVAVTAADSAGSAGG
jgi:3-hydroxyacyl-[acyl-carrier-protein] dehydratase